MLPAMLMAKPDQIKLALNWKPEPQFGGIYAAQFQNIFSKENLSVEILEGGSGTPTIQMLIFGTVDAAIVSAEEILIANEKNPKDPVLAIFATFQTNPQVILTRADRKLISLEQLLNQKGVVSAQLGLSFVQFLRKKYPQNKVQWVPYTGGINGLLQEKDFAQQGFLTSEPLLARQKGVEVSSFLISEAGFNPYTSVVAVRRKDWIEKKIPLQKLNRALRSGWETYLKDPVMTNKELVKLNPSLDLKFMNQSAEAQSQLIKSSILGQMTLERWQALEASLRDLGLIKTKLRAEDQFVDLTEL